MSEILFIHSSVGVGSPTRKPLTTACKLNYAKLITHGSTTVALAKNELCKA